MLRKLLWLLCLTGSMGVCADRVSSLLRVERTARCMGTEFRVVSYGESAGQLEAASQAALEEAQRLDGLLSNYRPDSELSRVNREAAEHPVAVSAELFGLLKECLGASRRSEGSFDITVGALMKVWGFYRGSGHLPHLAEVRSALDRTGYRQVELNDVHHTVRFRIAGLALDPGGVGKGYAVDRMVAILGTYDIQRALVSGGGSSIYGLGTPPGDNKGWMVHIRDPKDATKTVATVYLNNCSISTSGNYEKFFWAEGHLYSHIMDPRTGFPAKGVLAVSVVTPKTIDSEIWAKPYYILGKQWTLRQKPKDFQVFMCEDRPGVNCEWLQ